MSTNSMKESVNEFGFELFKVFTARHKNDYRNLCFSPFAVFNSLLMIKIGSKNTSESQLTSVLRLKDGLNQISMLAEWQALRERILKANHDLLMSSNFLYIDSSVQLNKEYKNLLREYFDVKPKKVNFSNINETVNTINSDSKMNTDDVIDEMIAAKDINEGNKNVKLILTDSLFFRGFWVSSFDELEKQEFNFVKNGQNITAKIQMMEQLLELRYMYSQQLSAHIVSIPYATSDLRLIVILPKDAKSDGHYVIEYLNKTIFESIMTTLQTNQKTLVDVSLPRFALDAQRVSLQKTIKQMGAIDIFDESLADLSPMCDNKTHLLKLVHKAFILVDERGPTHSDIKVSRQLKPIKMKDSNTVSFKANHPFVFIITSKESKVALFMVYFGDPQEMLEVVRGSDLTPEQISQLLSH